jgi:cardiolipin synthase A/B
MKQQWRDGNQVELLINGDEFFPRVFDAINAAKREVILETFIFNIDEVGKTLQRVLIDAAKRGVRIEVTVDDYGSADLTKDFVAEMAQAGVHLHVFDPTPRLLGMRMNLFRRLHRKIVLIDGELAFVGGINFVSDHLIGYGPKAKQDYALQVRGPVVEDIRAACQTLLSRASSARVDELAKGNWDAQGTSQALFALRDNFRHKRDIERLYIRAFHAAKERIWVANAYFFPGYRILRSLRKAAQRGVKVVLILQGRPDMPWVTACSRMLYNYLLRDGVMIHEYYQRPLHGKVALVDDEWTTVGSSNLDPLSLSLNLEANIFIQDAALNQQLYEHLQQLVRDYSEPVDAEVALGGNWWRLLLAFVGFHFARRFPRIAGWFPAHSPRLETLSANLHAHFHSGDKEHALDKQVDNFKRVDDIKEPS